MKLPKLRLRIPPRERLFATLGPTLLALIVLGLFVLPNYLRAAEARRESSRVDQVTGEHLLKRSQLVALERDLAQMRAERTVRCRTLGEVGADRLVDNIARPVDGTTVRNQGIRLGSTEVLTKSATRPLDLVRRVVTIEMMGSFDAVFAVLDSAETIDQLVVPVRVDIGAIRGGPNEDISVRATIELHSYFRPAEAKR